MKEPPRPRDVRIRMDVPRTDEKRLEARRIADPRLAWILSLDQAELAVVWSGERARLRRLEARAAIIREGYHRRRFTQQDAAARLDDLARRSPNLLTTGVHQTREGGFQFSVFALTTAELTELDRLGVRVKADSGVRLASGGRVITAMADADGLARATEAGHFKAIELGRTWRPHLDFAVPAAELDSLASTTGRGGFTGHGVVIGIIDLATLDFYHPDFREPTPGGQTRVHFLWDQELDPIGAEQHPPGGGALPNFMLGTAQSYGVEYTAADIDAELAHYQPGMKNAYELVRHMPPAPPLSGLDGHGTAVAGCAAGNGAASGGQFRGGAPDAGIIYVRVARLDPLAATADHTQVLEAFAYVFARADFLGMPCVVNMSLGDLQGPHDGTSLGELFLDALVSRAGRAITLSAGNFNGDWRHARGATAPGQDTSVRLEFGGGARSSDAIELWYPGADRLDASFVLPDGTVFGPVVPQQTQQMSLSNQVEITLSSTLGASISGDNRITMTFYVPPGETLPGGICTLRLHGNSVTTGGFQAWLDRNNPAANFLPPHRHENEGTLGVPATARGPITVGAHDKSQAGPRVAGFSGRGPTRDLRPKPDLLATGRSITAAAVRHRNLSPASASAYLGGKNGTSYAAPLAAAACALLFECLGPATDCATLKAMLQARSAPLDPGQPGMLKVGLECP